MTIDAPVGLPVVVTVKVPGVLVLKVVLSTLVITGAAWKENDTVAVELAVRFVIVYLNESGVWEPALGVKVKLPFAFNVTVPPSAVAVEVPILVSSRPV